jgi:alpha-L-fucosidase
MPKDHLSGTIYDEPQIFGDASPGDYNDFYSQQLTELMSLELDDGSPADLFEIWLDGASGSNTVQTFAWSAFRDIIREHQPNAIMWGHQGVDARWVGNEEGYTVETNWHTINVTQDGARLGENDLMSGARDTRYWTPAESDARIRNGWFWHASESPKSADALMSMYMETVGRSVNLLLDVPPDTRGLVESDDIDSLMAFKTLRESFLDRELLQPGKGVTASSVRGDDDETYGPTKVLDGDSNTYWTMDDGETTGWIEIDLGGTPAVDGFITQEHIALGQRIGGYVYEAMVNGEYQTIVTGTSLGYKRIDRLDSAIRASRVRFRVTQANAVPLIQSIQLLGSN